MLVLSRKKSESVLLCNRGTMELIGVVSLVDGMSVKSRIGFHFGPEVNIIRVELTTLAGINLSELEKVPLGTVIVMRPAAETIAQEMLKKYGLSSGCPNVSLMGIFGDPGHPLSDADRKSSESVLRKWQ